MLDIVNSTRRARAGPIATRDLCLQPTLHVIGLLGSFIIVIKVIRVNQRCRRNTQAAARFVSERLLGTEVEPSK